MKIHNTYPLTVQVTFRKMSVDQLTLMCLGFDARPLLQRQDILK